jgi:hypothetical protein
VNRSFFIIFNRQTSDFKRPNGLRTMPAMYATRGIAQGILSAQNRLGFLKGYEVVEVTIEERWKK